MKGKRPDAVRGAGICTRAIASLLYEARLRYIDAVKAWDALPALTASLLIIGTNRYRLQRRFDQAEGDTEVVEPVLQFLFHDAPLLGNASDPYL